MIRQGLVNPTPISNTPLLMQLCSRVFTDWTALTFVFLRTIIVLTADISYCTLTVEWK